jgi:hypothetical protein
MAVLSYLNLARATTLDVHVRQDNNRRIIEVAHSPIPGATKSAWIAFYKETADGKDYISYTFLKNLTDRLYDVAAPAEAGRYVFRIFGDSSYNHLAVSETIEVAADGSVNLIGNKPVTANDPTAASPANQPAPAVPTGTTPVPRQADAMEQFHYAMENYYFKACEAEGASRESLCRQAVHALKSVKSYYPATADSPLTRETDFYLGMSCKAMGEDRAAADSFLAVIRAEIREDSNTRGFGTALSYRTMAAKQLLSLHHTLTEAERREVQHAL